MPSVNVSLPHEDYVAAAQVVDELGVTMGALFRIALQAYLEKYEPSGVNRTASEQAENICVECLSPIPANIPMRIWPGDRGPFCSLRCAGGEDLVRVMRNGDVCVTRDGRTGAFIEPGAYGYNRSVTCQACGASIEPEASRVKVPPRYYFCTTCTTPQDVADLLALPPTGTAEDILAALKKGLK